ncbi:N-acetylmuramoyl-L-alanine amidase [Streptomyces scopuliridis]|uniref:N-acetylmuramoyl-L-alanine amidase n=1 Tax=Streptomyces scopuliridis TaxID=452529 RepID=A0ACD4ZPG0_9ACTN|nr:N-acetylmuramoyl-L-alanine amidase [Streptomyces scopuliridis]WSC00375.1 N-acetylmuramoyl-L-alanine amidase [Streptomyces scopuliridis]WSC06014.1 N-acetylmuramoyl-L-alanine amidase [Streptomyces scopuliridis]
MSYDESQQPTRRRSGRSNLTVAVAALVPTAVAGWLVWQGMSGPDGGPSAASAAGVSSSASPATTPAPSPSGSARDDDVPGGTTPAKPSAPAGPLAGKVVVIDPGHNPRNRDHTAEINEPVDIGTTTKECDTTGTSTNAGYPEAEFTLDVSHRLRDLLRKEGATVTFTHDNERAYGPCVDERARIGNKAKADASISVHADGSAPGNRGFHVILPAQVKGGGADTTAIVGPSRDLGEHIVGNFVRETGSTPANYLGEGTGLDVRADLGGLNLSTVPKVFIECGNMRDSSDAELLTDPEWRQKAAQGLADGIRGFLKK